MTTRTITESDPRLALLNTLLTTPHRRLDQIWPVHRQIVDADPRFYVRLAAWYADHGDVRDHQEMFVIALTLSAFEGHRDVGLALLRRLPPYQVARVVDFVHGRKTTRKAPATDVAAPAKGTRGKRANRDKSQTIELIEEFGLFKSPPRSLRTEVTRYLRERESDPDRFDSAVLVARKAIKRLYALMHVKPGARAQKILFDNDPPADSRLAALRALAKAESPAEQARAIITHQIPYRVAASVVQQMTPAVLVALIERMSPQELINNVNSLQKRGAMDNPEIKSLIDQKLEAATTGKRVSALKAERAADAAGATGALRGKLERVADTQVKAKGRIKRPTALLIDKSGSMQQAIELGKRIGALVSAICEKSLYVYAFDNLAYPIDRPKSGDIASWERAMAGINAGGNTSCGVALDAMTRKGQHVEQIIMITDEDENTQPFFLEALKAYRAAVKADPSLCIVRTPGGRDTLERQCRAAGVMIDVFPFSGDYYSLPNLVPMLSRPSKLELLMEILEYPLPKRLSA